jgi:hypothetical protein
MLKKVFPRWYFWLLLIPYILYALAVWVTYEVNTCLLECGPLYKEGFFAWFWPLSVGVLVYLILHACCIRLYNLRHKL